MKIVGLDGKEHIWTLSSSVLEDISRSGLHLRARSVICEVFPFDRIYEDVSLPGTAIKGRNSVLFGDFYIPMRSLMIEVDGAQHEQYTSFFHKNKLEFARAKGRDVVKAQWCELNRITLVRFKHDETDVEWKNKL